MAERKRGSEIIEKIEPPMDRRAFLRRVAGLSGVAVGLASGGYLAFSDRPVREPEVKPLRFKDFRVPPDALHPVMAVARGQRVEAMARAAIDKLGGVNRFIQKGDRVLLKPNVGWDRQPEQAANTGPELVEAMVRICREAGAKSVWVTDVSLNDPKRCFARSGIEAATLNAGGNVRLPGREDFLATDMGGKVLKVWPVARFFHEVDKVINLPIVKHHSLSGCTLAMKNWYGVIGGQRNRLHQAIHDSIVDLAAAVRPTLTVMDATRVLKRNGPTGGNPADVVREETLIASLDEVALDSFCLGFLDLTPEAVPFLAMAQARGLGQVSWRELNVAQFQVG
ncbi:hypothetical protein SIID45300_00763 [Candidatus Magnetaquicoccaceae bacterium FCR-1]|uniref:DUF362 domain-containing protein n=1 Tax=Candidatus Magnetaquiglobus chichijimensis TaxID=3141448 RepID=A0ABQ0C6D9_9PROT